MPVSTLWTQVQSQDQHENKVSGVAEYQTTRIIGRQKSDQATGWGELVALAVLRMH